MTKDPEKNLQQHLEAELDALKSENAERLGHILRGLFACMKDLDSRLSAIEERLGGSSDQNHL